MSAFTILLGTELLAWFRIRLNLFWIILWPLFCLLLMYLVIPGSQGTAPEEFLLAFFPSTLVLVHLSTMISLAIRIAIKKEAGILRRLAVVPFPVWAYLVVQFLCSIVMAVMGTVGITAAALLLGIRSAGSWGTVFILFLAGSLTFSAIGFFLAGISRNIATANILAMITMMLLMFLSDMFIPLSDINSLAYRISLVLPGSPLVGGLRAVMMRGDTLLQSLPLLWVVAAWGVGAIVLSLLTFRWDTRR